MVIYYVCVCRALNFSNAKCPNAGFAETPVRNRGGRSHPAPVPRAGGRVGETASGRARRARRGLTRRGRMRNAGRPRDPQKTGPNQSLESTGPNAGNNTKPAAPPRPWHGGRPAGARSTASDLGYLEPPTEAGGAAPGRRRWTGPGPPPNSPPKHPSSVGEGKVSRPHSLLAAAAPPPRGLLSRNLTRCTRLVPGHRVCHSSGKIVAGFARSPGFRTLFLPHVRDSEPGGGRCTRLRESAAARGPSPATPTRRGRKCEPWRALFGAPTSACNGVGAAAQAAVS